MTTNFGWSGRAAIAGCRCRVPLWCAMFGGVGVMTNFGGVDVLPLLGAIVGCHCGVLCLGGRVTTNFWGSGRAAIAGCHRSVRLWCAMVGG